MSQNINLTAEARWWPRYIRHTLWGRIFPTYPGYSWRWSCHLFYVSHRTISWKIRYTLLSL